MSKTLAFLQTHFVNEMIMDEFYKMKENGGLIDECVLFIDNRNHAFEDNGEILQEKEFFGQKALCFLFDDEKFKQSGLPVLPNPNDMTYCLWFNADYALYIMKQFVPGFDFYWRVEYDCFFNAPNYMEFFKLYKDRGEDLLILEFRDQKHDDSWCWTKNVTWFYPKDVQLYGSFYPIQRLSVRLIDRLKERKIEAGKKYLELNDPAKNQWLFCEIFTPTETKLANFSTASLKEGIGHCGLNELDLNTTRLFTKPDYKMYHPVKGNFIQRLIQLQNQINNKNKENATLKQEKSVLEQNNKELQGFLQTFEFKKQNIELEICKIDQNIKKLQQRKLEKELGMKLSQLEPKINLSFTNPNSATARIKNHLAYKLGVAIIANSKSLKGYVRMLYVLSYIKDKHKEEQNLYQLKIKENPNLALPKLEDLSDYKEALSLKEHLSYKLGEALIAANNRGGGGLYVLKFLFFDYRRIVKEFQSKKKR